jgi:DtxR family Mn-dependent transcriptional regulator
LIKLTKNEQDYLKAIYTLEHLGEESAVSIQLVAKKLSVAAPSATEMIKRLSKKELVLYAPYRGVSLSDQGIAQARFIIKSHRIWETFLVDKLGYSAEEVHDEAENLEHASSPKLVEYLYALLDYPETDPHGSNIPSEVFWKKDEVEIPLSQAKEDGSYYITALNTEAKNFFNKLNIKKPHFIRVIERLQDGSIIIKEDNTQITVIPQFLQESILLMKRAGSVTSSLKTEEI